ncbi:MAG: hypothetical protein H2042_16420 [Rhizobiales bacterium]|nr:hypothetical protein [Hyphomicrobiales bacterium]
MLIEFKTRAAGASRVFINPEQIVSVYVRADGCHIVTTERTDGGRSVHMLIDEPIHRVLAKLGVEAPANPALPGALPPRPAREGDGPTLRGARAGGPMGAFGEALPLPGEVPAFRGGARASTRLD